jgi:hypothetical protein
MGLCLVTSMVHPGRQSTEAHPRALGILVGVGAREVGAIRVVYPNVMTVSCRDGSLRHDTIGST